jgi:hypothetical protein
MKKARENQETAEFARFPFRLQEQSTIDQPKNPISDATLIGHWSVPPLVPFAFQR